MRKSLFTLPALLLLAVPLGAVSETSDPGTVPAGSYAIDNTHATVLAKANHLGFTQTTVRFDAISGSLSWDPARPEASSADISVDTAGLLSGFAPRDGHLKGANWLNVDGFPKATFKATRLEKTGANTANLPGELTLLGITRPLVLAVRFNGFGKGMDGKPRLGFTGTGTVKRSDYGMKGLLGPIADEVAIEVEAEFAQN
jgi:polyisoprenoid-binding protein YceI